MSESLPYMVAYSRLGDILTKIRTAQTPERFTSDFLSTKLGFPKAADRAVISLLKRMGFLASDGSPTATYNQFRNASASVSGAAMAKGIRSAYDEIYQRNEYAHELPEKDLRGLLVEVSGAKASSPVVKRVAGTLRTLLEHANFEVPQRAEQEPHEKAIAPPDQAIQLRDSDSVGMNLSYTINLNLPPTSDIAVFNAIFSALRAHLLKGLK